MACPPQTTSASRTQSQPVPRGTELDVNIKATFVFFFIGFLKYDLVVLYKTELEK